MQPVFAAACTERFEYVGIQLVEHQQSTIHNPPVTQKNLIYPTLAGSICTYACATFIHLLYCWPCQNTKPEKKIYIYIYRKVCESTRLLKPEWVACICLSNWFLSAEINRQASSWTI